MTKESIHRERQVHTGGPRRIVRPADLVLAVAIVMVAMAVAAAQTGRGVRGRHGGARSDTAVVVLNDAEYARIPLSPQRGAVATTIEIPTARGSGALVEVSTGGRVRMARSDCPDQVCVRTGWIAAPGEAIVCLPNRIVVRIEGETGADAKDASQGANAVDAVAY